MAVEFAEFERRQIAGAQERNGLVAKPSNAAAPTIIQQFADYQGAHQYLMNGKVIGHPGHGRALGRQQLTER